MNQRQSPRGTLPRKPLALEGTNGSRARPLDFDVDLELDIDWDGIGFTSPAPRPPPAPASERKPLAPNDAAPVSRIAAKEQKPSTPAVLKQTLKMRNEEREPSTPAVLKQTLKMRNEEEEAPTRVYVARVSENGEPPPAPPEAAPDVPQVQDGPPVSGNSTLIMDHAKLVGSAAAQTGMTSGQTLVMTREQMLGRTPKPGPEEASTDTKLMRVDEMLGRAPHDADLASGAAPPDVVDEDAGPHTKMMPIEALMKRANAQQRWPLPAVAIEAQVRNAARGAGKRSFFGRLGDGWRNTSLVTKASLLLMPLLCAVILVRYGRPLLWPKAQRPASAVSAARKAPPAKPSSQHAPAASAASPVGDQAALPASSAPEPTAAGSAAPESSARAAPAASGAELAGSAQPPASSAAPEPAPPARGSGSGAVTAQRKAADSVAEGDYAAAVERYRSLAKDEPGVQAYREAARILEERANGARR
jgi:hypothetical protein